MIYTPSAKIELLRRFTDGYVTGTGFGNDIAKTLTDVTAFLADPDQYRPNLNEDQSVTGIPAEGQSFHTTALHAFATDNVSNANVVATELLAIVNATDLNTTFWNDSGSLRWDDLLAADSGSAMWGRTGKFKKLYISYKLIESLQTTLTSTEEAQINTWFQRFKELAETGTKNRLDTQWGANWENTLVKNYGDFENQLYPETVANSNTPITDAVGVVDARFTMILGQDSHNNRVWDAISYVHLWATENGDSTGEFWTRQAIKMTIKYCVFPDGSYWELMRNRDSDPPLGVFYSNIAINGMIEMAHTDAIYNHYPTDKLYDYETSDGILNGSTDQSVSAYVGGSTTDGSTLKGLKTLIIGQSKYYRTPANGGWSPVRYYTSFDDTVTTEIDMEGNYQPSTQAAIANLYYKDQDIQDYYLFNTTVGYPVKQNLLVGSLADAGYSEDYGAWGSLTQGAMWLEMEDNFFTLKGKTTVNLNPHSGTGVSRIYLGNSLIK